MLFSYRKVSGGWILVYIFFTVTACGGNQKAEKPDAYNRGTLHISCDESFRPVMDAQVQVYQASYPDVRLLVDYKPEAECLKDLFTDSVRMIIATRGFSEREERFIKDSLHVTPYQYTIARDLIAVIINPAQQDSFFSMQKIKDLLLGRLKEPLIPVLDGTSSTSTVRFMLDSVLKSDNFGPNVKAADNTQGVINYVAGVPDAVGFIGFSWIGNMDDTAQQRQLKRVMTANIESADSVNVYVQPSQYFIYTKSYPMVRDLVCMVKENHIGLAHGFSDFLKEDRGQLLFRRSYLMPALRPNYLRNAELITDRKH